MTPAETVRAYLVARDSFIESATPGNESARELSDITDRAVSAMAGTALSRLRRPWALLALGGWGAGRLLPGSDLDLLVLTDAPAAELLPAISEVLYPLWDAGLKVGQQVRSPRDHIRVCRDDRDTLTATLTGRTIAGDRELADKVLARVGKEAAKRGKRLLKELASRERPGSPYLLEPDLKEGAGGQRDLDELAWSSAVLGGVAAFDASGLAGHGVLDVTDVAALADAGDRITAARWVAHLSSTRTSNALTPEVADSPGLDSAALQCALASVHHRLLRARALLSGGAPAPAEPMDAGELFSALDRGASALAELEDAAWSGRLDDLVPSLSDLMCLRRPALTHLYTVGAHSLRCAIAAGTHAAEGADRRVLQTAALLHDVGKALPGPGHAERGAGSVMTLGVRFGLDDAQTRDAALLVREHLLLAVTAATEDSHDEDVLLRVAARVRRPDLARALLALTAADSAATGPDMWSPWHATLVGELADRVVAELVTEADGAALSDRAEEVRAEALAALGAGAAQNATGFVRAASVRYLSAQRPADVVAHASLVAEATAAGPASPPHTAVSAGVADGTWRVTVAARDRAGLFASLAGTLALNGLDILAAEAYGAADGIALDTFTVRSDTLAEIGTDTWAALDRTIRSALGGSMDLDARLAERRKRYARGAGAPTTVSIEDPGAYATAVHVRATDRVGLLHDVAKAIHDEGLDIRWVKATTRDGAAHDVFHVTDAAGEPVDDPGVLGHLAMRIRDTA